MFVPDIERIVAASEQRLQNEFSSHVAGLKRLEE
jgi:hypothetical protein